MSLEAAIQSLADAIRDHTAALRGQGVLPFSFGASPNIVTQIPVAAANTSIAGANDWPAKFAESAGVALMGPVQAASEYAEELNAAPLDVEPEPEPEPTEQPKRSRGRPPKNAPAATPLEPLAGMVQSDDPAADEPEPAPPPPPPTDHIQVSRDRLREYLMTVARPVPSIGTAGCQRLIQKHGGVGKLSDVPNDKLIAVYKAAVAEVEAASDDLG